MTAGTGQQKHKHNYNLRPLEYVSHAIHFYTVPYNSI